MKILIFGLPGSGKTTLAKELAYHFLLPHINADTIREYYDDWDFSTIGRLRQCLRMNDHCRYGIMDFVAPTNEIRSFCRPAFTIWMDTIKEGRFKDTNKMFQVPSEYDIRIQQWIGQDQLRSSLEGFSPGIKGIQSYLNGPFQKLVK